MQNTVPAPRPRYRERLAPSLWVLAATGVLAPMVTFTLMRVAPAAALALGVAVAVLAIALFVLSSPRVSVEGTTLRVGRAHIDVQWLADPIALNGDEAKHARGPGLPATGWHLIRGGIDGMVVVANTDPDDPVNSWSISTRTPDRLAAAIRRAKA